MLKTVVSALMLGQPAEVLAQDRHWTGADIARDGIGTEYEVCLHGTDIGPGQTLRGTDIGPESMRCACVGQTLDRRI